MIPGALDNGALTPTQVNKKKLIKLQAKSPKVPVITVKKDGENANVAKASLKAAGDTLVVLPDRDMYTKVVPSDGDVRGATFLLVPTPGGGSREALVAAAALTTDLAFEGISKVPKEKFSGPFETGGLYKLMVYPNGSTQTQFITFIDPEKHFPRVLTK